MLTLLKIFKTPLQLCLAFIRLLLLIAGSFLFLSGGLAGYYFARSKIHFSRKLLKGWGSYCITLLNIDIDLHGQIPGYKCLVVSNHRSYLDILIYQAVFPVSMVAKAELKTWPIIGWAVKVSRMILVDRSKMKSLIQTMQLIADEIQAGNNVLVFPEGTTFKGPDTLPFKSGVFDVGIKSHIPVVPATIYYQNENDAWVGDDNFIGHFFRQMGKWKTCVSIWFNEPLEHPEPKSLRDLCRKVIEENLVYFSKH